MLKESLNHLFKPFDKDKRLKKEKLIMTITSWDISDLGYIKDQFANTKT